MFKIKYHGNHLIKNYIHKQPTVSLITTDGFRTMGEEHSREIPDADDEVDEEYLREREANQ